MSRFVVSLVPLFLAAACASTGDPSPTADDGVAYLTPAQHLVRASMALRGIRPSLDELEAVNADPDVLPAIVDYYLDSDEFGLTVREMHSAQLLANVDAAVFPAGFPATGPLEGMDVQQINLSVVEAPGRYAEHVVMNDRPYHEIVTGDYTYVDPIVATIFGIPYDGDTESGEWIETHFSDGRPHAGVLADSYLFTRHSSTFSNKSRGRAAFVARSFLCYDFLSREVEIDTSIDLSDDDAVANAIENNPACVSCHQTLDPLAAHFADYYPIYVPAQIESYPFEFAVNPYASFSNYADTAFFGEPSLNVRDLGVLIASDPRFSTCTARRFYSYLAQVPSEQVPLDVVSRLNDVFLVNAQSAKALARAVVLSDEFRVSHATVEDGADALHGIMKTRPEQLARLVEDLTGYRWRTRLNADLGGGNIGDIDLMTDSFFGFDVLAGGTDGQNVTRPAYTMTATASLVLRGLAAQAAPYAVDADFAETDPTRRWLLRSVEPETSDETEIRAQLADLALRFYGVDHEELAEDVDAAWAVFSGALATSDDPVRAWKVTLFAMLQDIRIAYY